MHTGTWPANAKPVDMPICISSATGSSSSLSAATFFSVPNMAVPGQATACPRKTVRGSLARYSIARQISSKYFILELYPDAGARVRVFGLIGVVGYDGVLDFFVSQHGLIPHRARISAHRFAVVFYNKTYGQLMVNRVFDAFVNNAGFSGHFTEEAVHAVRTAAALDAQRHTGGNRDDATDDSRGDHTVLGEAERDGTPSEDLGLDLLRRHAFEQALVMAAPGTHHPIIRSDVAEHLNDLSLVAIV